MLRPYLLLICALCSLSAQSIVEGTVVESVSKSPVSQAAVQIRYTKPLDGSNVVSVMNTTGPATLTDDAGRFRVEVPSPSEFRFAIYKNGFSPIEAADSPVIALKQGESKGSVTLTLTAECAIEGHVFDPDLEKPIAGLRVSVWPYQSFGGPMRFLPGSGTKTDAEGKYRISGLKPGKYRLIAGPSVDPKIRPLTEENGPQIFYPKLYFPGSPDDVGAATIELAPGAQQGAMDFRMTRAKVVRVHGKLVRADGQPVRGSVVFYRRITSETGMSGIADLGQMDNPSAFEISTVGEEPFELQAMLRGTLRNERFRGAVSIAPGRSGADDIVLTLMPGVTITGTLHSEGANPGKEDPLWTAASKEIGVTQRSETYVPMADEAMPTPVSRTDGSWRIDHVMPSALRLDLAGLPPGYVITAMSYNSADTAIGRVEMSPGAIAHHVDITVAQVANSISGSVTRNDKPVSGAFVYLLREPVPTGRAGWRQRQVKANERGVYSISSLEPGGYRLCAIPPDGDLDVAMSRLMSIESQRIEITKTTNATLNLSIP